MISLEYGEVFKEIVPNTEPNNLNNFFKRFYHLTLSFENSNTAIEFFLAYSILNKLFINSSKATVYN